MAKRVKGRAGWWAGRESEVQKDFQALSISEMGKKYGASRSAILAHKKTLKLTGTKRTGRIVAREQAPRETRVQTAASSSRTAIIERRIALLQRQLELTRDLEAVEAELKRFG